METLDWPHRRTQNNTITLEVVVEKVFIISGPSGVGKGTLIQKLINEFSNEIFLSVSVTTRYQRAGEIDGVSYDYISTEEYQSLLEKDALIEHAEYAGGCYGSRRSALNALKNSKSVIFEVDVQGKKQIVDEIPQAVTVFILPPSLDELKRRLESRGTESSEKMKTRIETAKKEILESTSYRYQIINDNFDDAYRELREIFFENTR